ncbi:unnamed protein product [Owenia fusiformis]|uniref:Uncharacterized protein n=1 Tax=Owenia fusiformis TaxID=6347 RepID=A0A8S4PYZ0_OWEFU|nr:unnamed protein product [Owenia fusiformis]
MKVWIILALVAIMIHEQGCIRRENIQSRTDLYESDAIRNVTCKWACEASKKFCPLKHRVETSANVYKKIACKLCIQKDSWLLTEQLLNDTTYEADGGDFDETYFCCNKCKPARAGSKLKCIDCEYVAWRRDPNPQFINQAEDKR